MYFNLRIRSNKISIKKEIRRMTFQLHKMTRKRRHTEKCPPLPLH
ncbi:hypothetical protein HMPREF9446_03378 [Bacteroides fluxus YIT 12057]|uniref:Uncharacterized protein n=1 Tax=Bacteroides fluxus YIT 12057 TaxID=763034 RepID=F3PX88_9BACE|nr:hypothetical protein HMPREF9446_03378 [Bacteroides fluxus YIT 12057]